MIFEEQIVSFEVAKLAAEKGFPQYTSTKMVLYNPSSKQIDSKPFGNSIVAPTQTILSKWLREIHYILVMVESKYNFRCRIYTNQINHFSKEVIDRFPIFTLEFETYEEALEDGLLQALKLI